MDDNGDHDHGFYSGDQYQGGSLPHFPLNSPSWYTPNPDQFAPMNNTVWNQNLQISFNETAIPSNALPVFSSSSEGIGVPIMPMDQNLSVDDMFLDGSQYPNVNLTDQVINHSHPISGSDTNVTTRYSPRKLWTAEEDRKLSELVSKYGTRNWALISDYMDGRAGKQCRERWYNNLRPDIKSDDWTEEEERILIEAHERLGNKWKQIAQLLPGRTENSTKNHWNAAIRKKTTRFNKIKKNESSANANAKPKSTILRDYIRAMSSTSTTESMVQALDQPQSQTLMNPQGFDANADHQYGSSSVSFDHMQWNNSNQTDQTLLFPNASIVCPVGEPAAATFSNASAPVYGAAYGDMDMDFDLLFDVQSSSFSSL